MENFHDTYRQHDEYLGEICLLNAQFKYTDFKKKGKIIQEKQEQKKMQNLKPFLLLIMC